MKVIFDRTAHLDETSVLTNFEKKYEIHGDVTMGELIHRFIGQHLKYKGNAEVETVWRVVAITDMAMREAALVVNEETQWVNSPDETLHDFFEGREPVTLLGIYLRPEEAAAVRAAEKAGETLTWHKLTLPIRVDTKGREILALVLGMMALGSIALFFVQYNLNKTILTEAIIGAILCALSFYFLLQGSRNMVFSTRSVLYRNRYSKYEKFNAGQFEYLDWSGHGGNLKFVFKFEEKGRNYISADTHDFLKLVVWSVSNGIPLYTSDSSGRS